MADASQSGASPEAIAAPAEDWQSLLDLRLEAADETNLAAVRASLLPNARTLAQLLQAFHDRCEHDVRFVTQARAQTAGDAAFGLDSALEAVPSPFPASRHAAPPPSRPIRSVSVVENDFFDHAAKASEHIEQQVARFARLYEPIGAWNAVIAANSALLSPTSVAPSLGSFPSTGRYVASAPTPQASQYDCDPASSLSSSLACSFDDANAAELEAADARREAQSDLWPRLCDALSRWAAVPIVQESVHLAERVRCPFFLLLPYHILYSMFASYLCLPLLGRISFF